MFKAKTRLIPNEKTGTEDKNSDSFDGHTSQIQNTSSMKVSKKLYGGEVNEERDNSKRLRKNIEKEELGLDKHDVNNMLLQIQKTKPIKFRFCDHVMCFWMTFTNSLLLYFSCKNRPIKLSRDK